MITEFLFLLCLGLCLGYEDEEKNDTTVIFVATFSCLSLLLLFLAVFFIYRCSQHEPAIPNFPSRRKQAGDRPEVTYAQLNTNALSETASSPAEMSPESCDYATLKE
ncbi:V-set and transmembrane domain-containing protein 1 precursor [Camelus ferus]|nr:V-set and transmembrane domain-containing protein 1 precursor [Camelus ferus]